MQIQTRTEGPRGCGYRKPGGLYLVGGGPTLPCGKLPIPLGRCEHCGEGILFSRAARWVKPASLIESGACSCTFGLCGSCPAAGPDLGDRALLIWVGHEFYTTPADFLDEARDHGFSRRIKNLPDGFVVGETWVLFAHVQACHGRIGRSARGPRDGDEH